MGSGRVERPLSKMADKIMAGTARRGRDPVPVSDPARATRPLSRRVTDKTGYGEIPRIPVHGPVMTREREI